MSRAPHRWDPVCSAPVGLVRPVRIDPKGEAGPTRGQARGKRWVRTTHGFYVPAGVDRSSPEQRILEQSVRLPAGGAVTGWAGIRLWGANLVDGRARDGCTLLPVPLCLGAEGDIRGDERVQLLRNPLEPGSVVVRHGISCVSPERAVFDAMRVAPGVAEAVVLMDMAAAGRVTSLSRMWLFVQAHPGWDGAPQVRAGLLLASEHSRSPNETRMRMRWRLDAGLPEPLVNQPIFDLRGTLLGYPDLLDEEAGLVGEYDGAEHRGAARHSKDVGREDVFRRHGLEMFHVTGPDMDRTREVVQRMHAARARARWLPPDRRSWTSTPPPWWRPGLTLDQRLDRRDRLRVRRPARPSPR